MGTPKILIVDDEPFNLDYLEQELGDVECDIVCASNGLEALEKVEGEQPDLVLLDIMMPVMDGFTVLGRMKSNPGTREIPVIIISANNDLHSVAKGIEMGAEDYLPKPFEPVLLHARVTSSLEKKQLRDIEQLYLKSLEHEFEIARDIQASFLPNELPQPEGWETAAYFKAAREVAGDFYDVFEISEDMLVCTVGDVCGKGVGAALFMTLFRSLIRSAFYAGRMKTGEGERPGTPGELLQEAAVFVNEYVATVHGEACMFATIFLSMIDLKHGRLTYVNCGNEPALMIAEDEVVAMLMPTGPAAGILPDASYEAKEMVFEVGQVLVAYTDGVTDALDEEGASFGRERLVGALCSGPVGAEDLLKGVEGELRAFMGSAQPFDDITLLAVRRS